jgi:hypothetical protein
MQIPQKNFLFESFSSISLGLCICTKGVKVIIFGFDAGTKGEKLNFFLHVF